MTPGEYAIMFQHLKIIHTVCHRQWAGLEQRVFNEAGWMTACGHHVSLVVPLGVPLFENAAKKGWPVYPMEFTKAGMIKDAVRLRRLLRDLRPDVLNAHGNLDIKVGLSAAYGLGIPCVILSRHVSPPVQNSWYNRRLYRDLCHLVFTTSTVASRQIENDLGVNGARIRTIPSGIIPPVRLSPRTEARAKVISLLGLPAASRFIGYVGRITPDKGVSDIVRAFAGIRTACPDHHLVFVGEGAYSGSLTAQIRDQALERRVHMVGFHRDRWSWFRAFDCKVIASPENDGIPQAVLEAMFARCPVVGARVGGIPDIIRHDETGLLVAPNRPDALGEAILGILQHPAEARRRMENACRFAWREHSIDGMGGRILGVYDEILSRRGSASKML